MLSGVATKYGKDSIQYSKAGGSNRKRGSSNAPAVANNSASNSVTTTNLNSNASVNAKIAELSLN
jgi:hypothetical protein